jgi:hypothetical protein
VIPKAERDADAAILAAATGGTWATVAPRSQEGGVQLAGFGGLDAPDVAVSLRVAGEWSLATAEQQGEMSWEQHAYNAKAAAHAVNRLPVYIEAAAEMERRIESVNAECIRLSRKLAATAIGDSDVAHADGFYEGLLWALRKMRDGQ